MRIPTRWHRSSGASRVLLGNEEGEGGCTGGDARQIVGATSGWTSLANCRRPNLAFPWCRTKRPIWLGVARLQRLVRQPNNMDWVAYGAGFSHPTKRTFRLRGSAWRPAPRPLPLPSSAGPPSAPPTASSEAGAADPSPATSTSPRPRPRRGGAPSPALRPTARAHCRGHLLPARAPRPPPPALGTGQHPRRRRIDGAGPRVQRIDGERGCRWALRRRIDGGGPDKRAAAASLSGCRLFLLLG